MTTNEVRTVRNSVIESFMDTFDFNLACTPDVIEEIREHVLDNLELVLGDMEEK